MYKSSIWVSFIMNHIRTEAMTTELMLCYVILELSNWNMISKDIFSNLTIIRHRDNSFVIHSDSVSFLWITPFLIFLEVLVILLHFLSVHIFVAFVTQLVHNGYVDTELLKHITQEMLGMQSRNMNLASKRCYKIIGW